MSRLIIALYVLTTSTALIVLKLGTRVGQPNYLKLPFNINALTISGVILYGISFMLYTYLIAKFDLGYIIPLVTAFVYILIFTASYFIFKETFTVLKISGIACIVAGLILLNIKK